VREFCTQGSVGGAAGNCCLYPASGLPKQRFIVFDVARLVASRFDSVCWQTPDSWQDVLCRVESYGIVYACSALIGGVSRFFNNSTKI
jgi:hypothetical protein